ncbi:DUF6795 domain-containing protein [Microbulbifer sp. ZKSA006]|uniref:DUF6795 domain-containing protein n=1 Tax=Microbulbifer sp. ZKSA006 TaxID=3243390 RepID=UPI00403A6CB3
MKIATLLVITFLISACAINPHTEIWAPKIGGVLIDHGKPISGITIKAARTDWLKPVEGCPDSYREVVTDIEGKFLLPADEHFSLFSVMGDSVFSWKVCAIVNESSLTLWLGESVGIVTEKDNATLKCDISNESTNTGKGAVLCTRM